MYPLGLLLCSGNIRTHRFAPVDTAPTRSKAVWNIEEVVLTINDLNTYSVPTKPDIRPRTRAIAEAAKDADIVTFQEVVTPYSRHHLQKLLDYPYMYMPRTHARLVPSGLATFSRYPIVDRQSHSFGSITARWEVLMDKSIDLTRVEHPQLGILDIYDLHLHAGYKTWESYSDIRQDQMRAVIDFVRAHSMDESGRLLPGHTIILNGDFNMLPDSPEYKMLMEAGLGVTDVYRQLHPDAPLYTYERENPYVCPSQCPASSARIDYIFIRPAEGLSINWKRSRGRIDTLVNGQALSDHDFLQLQLVLEKTST